MRAWSVVLVLIALAGCGSAAVVPAYTDPKAECERHLGWWRPNLLDGYCERR